LNKPLQLALPKLILSHGQGTLLSGTANQVGGMANQWAYWYGPSGMAMIPKLLIE